MLLSHDTDLTLRAAAALINTARSDVEHLADHSALDRYLSSFYWTGRRDHDDSELAAVQALRARLGRIWQAAEDEERAVAMVNALLGDTHASPWLTRHPDMPEWQQRIATSVNGGGPPQSQLDEATNRGVSNDCPMWSPDLARRYGGLGPHSHVNVGCRQKVVLPVEP